MTTAVAGVWLLMAHPAGAGGGGANSAGDILTALDFDFDSFLLQPNDLAGVPAIEAKGPFDFGGAPAEDIFEDSAPGVCGKSPGDVFTGAENKITNTIGTTQLLNVVSYSKDARPLFKKAKALAKRCNTYQAGTATVTVLDPQPKLKKVGDDSFVLATESGGTTVIYEVFVRDGRNFMSTLIVGFAGPDRQELANGDLRRLGELMATRLDAMSKQFRADAKQR